MVEDVLQHARRRQPGVDSAFTTGAEALSMQHGAHAAPTGRLRRRFVSRFQREMRRLRSARSERNTCTTTMRCPSKR
ncbi:hypothetical protein, partial [Xanthomonas oryzae]|uniref:hypothetical protein n=1 Tax=Xanthomonas oryzae TaxID=347 RepID=UPI001C4D9294